MPGCRVTKQSNGILERTYKMKFVSLLKKFRSNESGAVTVDWVVLTAAIVGLGIAVMAVVGGGIMSVSDDIQSEITSTTVGFDATTRAPSN